MILWENKQELQSLITSVRKSHFSEFYANKYESLGDDFSGGIEDLPFLTREEVVITPADQRLYVSRTDVASVGFTSGTTSGVPMMAYFAEVDDYFFEPSLGLDVDRFLSVHPQLNKLSASVIKMCRTAHKKVTPVFGDLENLANTAIVAQQTQCDAIYSTPTLAITLAPYIKKYYDPSKIKLVTVLSELLTQSKYIQLETLYPNAQIANIYSSAEVGQCILYPCAHIMEQKETTFHLLKEALVALELIDGELVVTFAQNAAFPLIRYKTGDFFEVVDGLCSCGEQTPVLRLSGREGVDVLRVHGFEMRVGAVDSFFDSLPQSFSAYQIHVYPDIKNKDVVRLEIEVVTTESESSEAVVNLVRDAFLDTFKFTAELTAADVMKKGLISDIIVTCVERVSLQSVKTRVLVNHIS
ncbi:MAG: phenylacetate-coenzyme A ligase PaaK-like adenylate-forming protein [Acidimicrobiales bacterium]|jgi:phenylacetate-coenzyme A ligase PaaK-like adenylate-forming protein